MISLSALAELAAEHAEDLARPVAPFRVGDREIDTDTEPVLMGVVNLSRDSNYRESIAVSTAAAVRMGRVQAAQGAHLVDVGAESTRNTAARVTAEDQAGGVVPVVRGLAEAGVVTSIEGYDPAVLRAGLGAGARVVNLTGSTDDDVVFALTAEHEASLVLCHVLGPHVRALDGSDVDDDPVPRMLEEFGARVARARELGITSIAVDPGLGFGFRLSDPQARARHQAVALLASFRLRALDVPVCHALPHAFDLFGEQFRSGEGFFAVLAHLGRTGVYRTHEVPLVAAVLGALHHLPVAP